jgi:hypothetical protein
MQSRRRAVTLIPFTASWIQLASVYANHMVYLSWLSIAQPYTGVLSLRAKHTQYTSKKSKRLATRLCATLGIEQKNRHFVATPRYSCLLVAILHDDST